jgi:hypothetical protein
MAMPEPGREDGFRLVAVEDRERERVGELKLVSAVFKA